MTQLIDYLQTHIKFLVGICYGILAAIVGYAAFGLDTSHAHSWAEQHIPAFWSIFGITAAAVIIVVARLLGRAGLQVRTDFYDCCTGNNCNEEEK